MKSLNEYILLENVNSDIKELAKHSGLKADKIAEFVKRTEIDPHDLMQLLGLRYSTLDKKQKRVETQEFNLAVMNKPGNSSEVYIIQQID